VYGSNQVEPAWTVVPLLIVVVLFLATARVITRVQTAVPPDRAFDIISRLRSLFKKGPPQRELLDVKEVFTRWLRR